MKANNPGNVDISKTTSHVDIVNSQIDRQEIVKAYREKFAKSLKEVKEFVNTPVFSGFLGEQDKTLGTPIELYAAMMWMEATNKYEAIDKLNNRKVG